MPRRKPSSLRDPTAEEALNRVMKRMVRMAKRQGLPVIGDEIWECNDPRCVGEHLV